LPSWLSKIIIAGLIVISVINVNIEQAKADLSWTCSTWKYYYQVGESSIASGTSNYAGSSGVTIYGPSIGSFCYTANITGTISTSLSYSDINSIRSGLATTSDLSSILNKVDTAISYASSANTNASNAASYASSANTNASNAASYASSANTNASNAASYASNAASYASSANTNASNAASYASNAASYASSANTNASNAASYASSANTKLSDSTTGLSAIKDSTVTAGIKADNAKASADVASSRVWDTAESKSAATLAKEARDKATTVESKVNVLQQMISPDIKQVVGQNGATCTKGTTFTVVISANNANQYCARVAGDSWSSWSNSNTITVQVGSSAGPKTIEVKARNSVNPSAEAISTITIFKI